MATSTVITAPKTPVHLGSISIGTQTYNVIPHPEYMRFFFDLMRRVGGVNGVSNGELLTRYEQLQAGEMQMQPMPAPAQFADVMQSVAAADNLGDAVWQRF